MPMRLPRLRLPYLPLPRLRPTRVRTRLTALYGMLFAISGTALLAILYVLVSESRQVRVGVHLRPPPPSGGGVLLPAPAPTSFDSVRVAEEQAAGQHAALLQSLLEQSAIALAIMVALSILLGWLVAGRILRPLRTMTLTIQRISARNIHERLAVTGPDDEITDLAGTVNGLLSRLDSVLGAHKRFVANAAHELRTPLTLEHALVEEALIDSRTDTRTFRATFERVLEICDQQERLLESLLTLTTGERGLDRREPLDLATLATRALATLRPDLDRAGLSLDVRIGPAHSTGDPALVERLIANLVSNAIDYNIPGGSVRVTTATRFGRAVVSVANTGPRVPPGQVDRLFEPFHRLDRTAARNGHHGLGLSIVRSIAAAHDAAILARARPDGGLAVEISFPLETSTAPTPATGSGTGSGPGSGTAAICSGTATDTAALPRTGPTGRA